MSLWLKHIWDQSSFVFMSFVFTTQLCLLVINNRGTQAQFPAICTVNVTDLNATCCPVPPGYSQPCGGPTRGRCAKIAERADDDVPPDFRKDDRIDWPIKFFKYGCECVGNFGGYMCQDCQYGFVGENCTERIVRIRRDLDSLSKADRRYIMKIMEIARNTTSDYMILNTSRSADSGESTTHQFLNATVYDYLGYVHYYATRGTIKSICSASDDLMDFAHKGSNFPLWHRYFMITWEKEMQRLSGDSNFTFPYWNWTDAGRVCDICTNEFVGAMNYSSEGGLLDSHSAVSSWYALCPQSPYPMCDTCDPHVRYDITRYPGYNLTDARFPTKAEVDYVLSRTFYDLHHYSENTTEESFRGAFEGYAESRPERSRFGIHNMVHNYLGGTMGDLTMAAFDPIFYFHHSFMDKLFEIWLRRTQARPWQLPSTVSSPGYNRNSYLVGFYPVVESEWLFRTSRDLGYDYDDMMESVGDESPEEKAVSTSPYPVPTNETDGADVHPHINPFLAAIFPNISNGLVDQPSGLKSPQTLLNISMTSKKSDNNGSKEIEVNFKFDIWRRAVIGQACVIAVLLIALLGGCISGLHRDGFFRWRKQKNNYMQIPVDDNDSSSAIDLSGSRLEILSFELQPLRLDFEPEARTVNVEPDQDEIDDDTGFEFDDQLVILS